MTTLLTDLLNPLEQKVRERIVTQYNRATPILNYIRKEAGSGKNNSYDVTFGTGTGQSFVEGADVVTFNKDTEVMATLPWCEYGDAFEVTGRAEDAAAGSMTELDNLYTRKAMQAMTRVALKMEADICTGAGTAGPEIFHGFTNATGPLGITGTYANIARGTYAQWQSNKLANAGVPRALTLALLHQALEDNYTNGNGAIGGISAIFMGPGLWRKYGLLAAADRRQTVDALRMREVMIRGQRVMLDAGWEALDFSGIPVFRSVNLTTSAVFLNENHISMSYLPPAPARVARGEILATLPIAGTPDEQTGANGQTGLTASLIELSKAGNKSKFQVVGEYSLAVDKCNAHNIIVDLDASL
jgi:hypothetical protein